MTAVRLFGAVLRQPRERLIDGDHECRPADHIDEIMGALQGNADHHERVDREYRPPQMPLNAVTLHIADMPPSNR